MCDRGVFQQHLHLQYALCIDAFDLVRYAVCFCGSGSRPIDPCEITSASLGYHAQLCPDPPITTAAMDTTQRRSTRVPSSAWPERLELMSADPIVNMACLQQVLGSRPNGVRCQPWQLRVSNQSLTALCASRHSGGGK